MPFRVRESLTTNQEDDTNPLDLCDPLDSLSERNKET